jgi:hypothetical protein
LKTIVEIGKSIENSFQLEIEVSNENRTDEFTVFGRIIFGGDENNHALELSTITEK